MTFSERVRHAFYLASVQRRWPWVLLVLLALVVTGIETVGALMVFALLGLATPGSEAVSLPVVGDLQNLLGTSNRDSTIAAASLMVGAFFILRAAVTMGTSYVQSRVTQSAGARLASRLHAGYLSQPWALHATENSSTKIRNINDTVASVVSEVFVRGTRMMSEAIITLGLIALLVATSPFAMGLLAVVAAPGVLLLGRVINPRLTKLGREAQNLAASTLKVLQESLQHLREIRVMQAEDHFEHEFGSRRYELARSKYRRSVLTAFPGVALETSLILFICAFLLVTIGMGRDTEEALPVIGMFGYVGLRLKPSLTQIIEGANSLRYAGPSIADLYEDLRRAERWRRPDPGTPLTFRHEIQVDHVTFHYPVADRAALVEADLVIRKGTSVGFVGSTGAGKSTLADLIVGLLEPSGGAIRVDGCDIKGREPAWFQHLGVVSQNVALLDASLRRNIAFGTPEDKIDEDRLRRAIELAQLDEVVQRSAGGLDTVLGERGVRLSGGQRQRVAIARALYREPEVLVFDEGTSALDNRTEAALMGALQQLRGDRTIILVAHRLSTVRHCDEIHVLDAGSVVASGTYEVLLEQNEQFRLLSATTDE